MKIKRIKVLSILLIVIMILRQLIIGKIIHTAVKAPRYDDFIVVREARVTDYGWKLLNPETHEFIEYINVENDSELTDFDYEFFIGHNKYYLYGSFIEDPAKGKIFIYRDWDFIYPINHAAFSIFLLSPKYVYECEK